MSGEHKLTGPLYTGTVTEADVESLPEGRYSMTVDLRDTEGNPARAVLEMSRGEVRALRDLLTGLDGIG